MKLLQLQYFQTVCKYESITKAAGQGVLIKLELPITEQEV